MRIFSYAMLTLSLPVLASCGELGDGGSDSKESESSESSETYNVGVFKDSRVEGVYYETNSTSGFTNKDGEFKYKDGEVVEFGIGQGDNLLGKARGERVVTPYSMASSDTGAVNRARFLMALDEDQDPSNGLKVPTENPRSLPGDVNFDSERSFEESVPAIENSIGRSITGSEAARQHLSGAQKWEVLKQSMPRIYKAATLDPGYHWPNSWNENVQRGIQSDFEWRVKYALWNHHVSKRVDALIQTQNEELLGRVELTEAGEAFVETGRDVLAFASLAHGLKDIKSADDIEEFVMAVGGPTKSFANLTDNGNMAAELAIAIGEITYSWATQAELKPFALVTNSVDLALSTVEISNAVGGTYFINQSIDKQRELLATKEYLTEYYTYDRSLIKLIGERGSSCADSGTRQAYSEASASGNEKDMELAIINNMETCFRPGDDYGLDLPWSQPNDELVYENVVELRNEVDGLFDTLVAGVDKFEDIAGENPEVKTGRNFSGTLGRPTGRVYTRSDSRFEGGDYRIRITAEPETTDGSWGGVVCDLDPAGYILADSCKQNGDPENYMEEGMVYQGVVFEDSNNSWRWDRHEEDLCGINSYRMTPGEYFSKTMPCLRVEDSHSLVGLENAEATLESPSGAVETQNPKFSWEAMESPFGYGGFVYKVEVFKDGEYIESPRMMASELGCENGAGICSFDFSEDFSVSEGSEEKYRWGLIVEYVLGDGGRDSSPTESVGRFPEGSSVEFEVTN